jgi:FAD/FMN-containing dehydrogenase
MAHSRKTPHRSVASETARSRVRVAASLTAILHSRTICPVPSHAPQSRALWQLRETITEGLAKEGAVYKYDISLPVKTMYDMVLKMKSRLGSKVGGVVGYGHLGDGNLHLNIYTPKFSAEVLGMIEPYLFEQTGQSSMHRLKVGVAAVCLCRSCHP